MASVGKAVSKDVKQQIRTSALAFLSFLNKSVTPFHAVESCESILKSAGFVELFENQRLKVQPKGKFYIKKNETSIFAFAVGGAFNPTNTGYSMVVAHTDSPCLRVKPISKRTSEQFLQVGVSPYGGGVWRSWFDRDLSIAGQVIFKGAQSEILHKLIDFGRPVLHIPNLAIHLDNDRGKFEFNSEQHLRPILAQVSSDNSTKDDKKVDKDQLINGISIIGDHHDILLKSIGELAGCEPEELLDLDLYLYDTQPANLTGLEEEFISGARLDNLVGTYTSIMGLVQSLGDEQAFSADQNIRLVACFDNEEVGSVSAQGAASHFMEWLMRRIVASPDEPNAFECAIGRSYLVSADQAHACHPNYANKHEDCHKPTFNKGVVVKINANQRYATSAVTHSIFKIIAESAGIPIQKVVARSDQLCGSTVGPILAAKLGIQTIDVGCPQLAMHSIRELGDTSSIHYATTLYSQFFNKLPSVLGSLKKHEPPTLMNVD
uniref:Aspartyl aminopeptidase n=1 Tax=Meloidogyne incognita TaxID=6306 RepID=A0A914KTW6_MELIC